MLSEQAGEMLGGFVPAIAVAAITGNPELVPAEVAGEAGVKDFAVELRQQGYDAEIFDGSIELRQALVQFKELAGKGCVPDDQLVKTKMFEANEYWALNLKKQGNPVE